MDWILLVSSEAADTLLTPRARVTARVASDECKLGWWRLRRLPRYGSMDDRLWLHNAIIGLSHPSPPWPRPLADAEYRLVRVEQPVDTFQGSVTVDLLFLARSRSALLAVECKDGTLQEPQASCYEAMTPLDLIQSAGVSVQDADAAVLDVAYALPEARAASVVAGLAGEEWGRYSLATTFTGRVIRRATPV